MRIPRYDHPSGRLELTYHSLELGTLAKGRHRLGNVMPKLGDLEASAAKVQRLTFGGPALFVKEYRPTGCWDFVASAQVSTLRTENFIIFGLIASCFPQGI